MADNWVFHVGLHKTGTTWLQLEFFPKISKKQATIISNEYFSGRPFRLTIDDILPIDERFYYADLIKQYYGDVKIILGLRNKKDIIKSMYSEYLKGGGTELFDIWKKVMLNPRYFEYDEYIDYLQRTFTKVFVYWYEDFKQDKWHVLMNMCKFIDCNVPYFEDVYHNVGLYGHINHLRWLLKNNWIKKKQHFKKLVN